MNVWDEIARMRDQEHERREAGLHILAHPYHPNGVQGTICEEILDAGVDAWDVSDLFNDLDDFRLPVTVCKKCCMEFEILFLRYLMPGEVK